MDTKTFTEKYYVDRKNTDCVKWDREDIKDNLPMFIADMDFKSPQEIIDNLKKRLDHGAFGYSFLPKDYKDELIKWNKKRNSVTYKKDWIRFSNGAVNGLAQILTIYTKEKDGILINPPEYPPFAATIKGTKRTVVASNLIKKDGIYTFNFKDIENKFKSKKVKAMVLCTPHNPMGRVWKKEELAQLFKLTHKYHILVISDEVHSDLIMPGHKFVQSLSFKEYQNEIITLTTASKTFSLAIFNHCHVIIPNEKLRAKFDAFKEANHESPNAFNGLATYYGYKYCEYWLDSVIDVIYENYNYLYSRLSKYVEILPLEGTYLVFANFEKYTKNAYKFLYDKCKIVTNPGETFDSKHAGWARINLATSLDNVKLACDRIEKALNK